jgi:iron complex transport system permease protein
MSRYVTMRSRSGRVSFLLDRRAIFVLFLLILLAILLFIAGLSAGSTFIHPWVVIRHLLGLEDSDAFVIETLRLPRMALAMLAGASLGVAGLILQGMVRNPLASPDIIGITGGASAAAVFWITYFSHLSLAVLPFVALAGAGMAALAVFSLAWKKGITPIRLVLIGIGVQALMSGIITMLIVLSPTYSTIEAYIWLTGSVYGADWGDVRALLPWVLVFVPAAVLLSRVISVQELGDDLAYGLGMRVQFNRLLMLFISVALAGSAVAYAGGIGFIGLIAPHIARRLIGRSFGHLVPVSALVGGMIVVSADVMARTLFLPLDLPAGVFVSGVGAPFFVYLLYRNRHL